MKTKERGRRWSWCVSVLLLLIGAAANADTVWTSGHHEIFDGETYHEIWMYNGASADMWGGDVGQIGLLGSNTFDMHGGSLWWLMAGGSSTTNLYAGNVQVLDIGEDASLKVHAYLVEYHPTGGYWNGGWVSGRYINTNDYFRFDVRNENIFLSYVEIVPEPTTLLLLALGVISLRTKKMA